MELLLPGLDHLFLKIKKIKKCGIPRISFSLQNGTSLSKWMNLCSQNMMKDPKAVHDVANTNIQNMLTVSGGGGSAAASSSASAAGSAASSTGCLFPDVVQIQIEGSNSNLAPSTPAAPSSPFHQQRRSIAASSATYQEKEKVFMHAFKSAYKYLNRRRSLLAVCSCFSIFIFLFHWKVSMFGLIWIGIYRHSGVPSTKTHVDLGRFCLWRKRCRGLAFHQSETS